MHLITSSFQSRQGPVLYAHVHVIAKSKNSAVVVPFSSHLELFMQLAIALKYHLEEIPSPLKKIDLLPLTIENMNGIFDKLPKSGHRNINLWVVLHLNPAYPAITTLADMFFLTVQIYIGDFIHDTCASIMHISK